MLEGIKVLELGKIFSAPLAGKILADLGASVIKIERYPLGDESRKYGMPLDDASDYYYALNYNKEVVMLNLKERIDLEKCYEYIKTADIIIHNSLQASFDRLGLSYEKVKSINPKIIYASISGYGEGSIFQNNPSQDISIQGLSGFMSLNGYKDDMPLKTGIPVIDYVTGQNAVIGVLAALQERSKTGLGKRVCVSLLESALGMISVEAIRYLNLGVVASRNGNRHYSIAPYNTYQTKDGYIIIAVANDEMFSRFASLFQIDFNKYETNALRLQKIDSLEKEIINKFSQYKTEELLKLLKEHKISCEKVNTIKEAFDSLEVKELSMIRKKDNYQYLTTPIRFKD